MENKNASSNKPAIIALTVVIAAIIILGILLYPMVAERLSPAEDKSQTENTNETKPADTKNEDTTEKTDPNAAPDFSVYDMNGNKTTLSEKKGKPVVINFFATWCPPCVGELPHFEEMYKKYGDKVEFMIVDLTDGYDETKEKVESFIDKNGYTFPVYLDSDIKAVVAYKISSIPLTVFVDEDGKIAASKVGAMDAETLEGYIKKLIEE
ncbi:MAG: TlpA family protein disulfide reductase [Ruminococcaceae bacterium]|nr:TlpA family protein disulfide reductase [Oscillospiraceae bacterium]